MSCYHKNFRRDIMKGFRKAQISIEMLVTLGMILSFTIPITLLFFSISQQGYQASTLAQADAASKTLADNINDVFSQGIGAKKSILLDFPLNMQYLTIANNEVIIRLKTSNGDYDSVAPIFANAKMVSTLKNKGGLVTLVIQNNQNFLNQPEVDVYG